MGERIEEDERGMGRTGGGWITIPLMRRAWRWMLNGLTGVSLILALLAAGVWRWSHPRVLVVSRFDARAHLQRSGQLNSRGVFFASKYAMDECCADRPSYLGLRYQVFPHDWTSPPHRHNFLGFGWTSPPGYRFPSYQRMTIPHWFLFTLFAALPSIRLFRYIRRKRLHVPGHCSTCGYDLRATPDRCPECGAMAAATPPRPVTRASRPC